MAHGGQIDWPKLPEQPGIVSHPTPPGPVLQSGTIDSFPAISLGWVANRRPVTANLERAACAVAR